MTLHCFEERYRIKTCEKWFSFFLDELWLFRSIMFYVNRAWIVLGSWRGLSFTWSRTVNTFQLNTRCHFDVDITLLGRQKRFSTLKQRLVLMLGYVVKGDKYTAWSRPQKNIPTYLLFFWNFNSIQYTIAWTYSILVSILPNE